MKRLPVLSVLVLLAAALSAAPPAKADPLPCADPRGCPDLVVDDALLAVGDQTLRSFAADDCAVLEGSASPGLRQLLRFTTASANLGAGDLVVGGPATDPDLFEWDPCHGHWHYRQFADYRLWTPAAWKAWNAYRAADPAAKASEVLAAHPELAGGFVAGAKRGFCLRDVAPAGPNRHAPPVVPDPPKYGGCLDGQGIGVGWADVYDAFATEGQWIDVTDVAPGPYVLEVEVNGEHVFGESDFGNNRGWLPTAVLPGPYNNGVADPDAALAALGEALAILHGFTQPILGQLPPIGVDVGKTLAGPDGPLPFRVYVALVDGRLFFGVTTPVLVLATDDEGLGI